MFRPVRLAVLNGFAVLMVAGFVTGCGKEDLSTDADASAPRVALVMKSLANEFFKTMADGAEAHQKASGGAYALIVNGIKDERDAAQQVTLVESMIAQKVDAIVIAPADSKALISVCRRAMDAGIVVVNIDNKLDAAILEKEGTRIPFVGPDNYEGAKMVGLEMAKHLSAGDEVAILEGVPTAFNAQQRRKGFEEAMAESGMKIVTVQSAQWETEKANTVASAILSEYPNLKAILASNDSMALGAVAAVKAADRVGQVAVVGFDNISAVQPMLEDGRILATADQHADQLAVYGIEYALAILRDTVTPEDKQTPVDLIVPSEK